MGTEPDRDQTVSTAAGSERPGTLGLAIALAALAAVGVGIAVQQALDRRLTTPEKARLKFYRYLRERGRLES
jgi:hypothetical protein